MTPISSEIFAKLLNTSSNINSEWFEKQFDISGSNVRACINEIIDYCIEKNLDYTVGGGGNGYFITRTENEFDAAIGDVYSREIKLRCRRQKLEKIRERKFGDKSQMSLL